MRQLLPLLATKTLATPSEIVQTRHVATGRNRHIDEATLRSLLQSGDAESVLSVVAELQRQLDTQATQLDTQATQLNTQAAALLEAAQQADDTQGEIRALKGRVKHLTRLLYGRRSERLTREEIGQLLLAFDADDDGTDVDPSVPTPAEFDDEDDESGEEGEAGGDGDGKPRRRHRGRTRLSEELPRCIDIQSVPDDQRACHLCGREMCSAHYRDHETVEYIPARFVVHVQRREILGCGYADCKGSAVTAPRKCSSSDIRLGASVITHMIESKCDDALPVYRQQDQFARLGAHFPVNTLYSAWNYGLDLLEPVATATLSCVLGGDVVAIDDTGMPVLETSKGGKKRRGHLWGFKNNTEQLVGFAFTQTWEAEEVAVWIQAIEGFIQVDDYKGYGSVLDLGDGNKRQVVPDELRLGCMMHVRRRFYDAFKLGDARAKKPLHWIRGIYKVEAEAKKKGLGPPQRHALRAEKSVPMLDKFYEWAKKLKPRLGKKSKLAEAVRYALNQKPYVERCFTDGRFEIDNGDIERTLRDPCLGRKNFLHAGSVAGAKRLATAYTLVMSCRALGINTREYLIDVITKLVAGWPMRRLCELVPNRWARDRGLLPKAEQSAK